MLQSRLEELALNVRAVFAAVPRPECTKRIALALDDEWIVTEERGRELSALDTEQNWWDVSDADLRQFCTVLPWLSPAGFRFYYPAFLSFAIRHWNERHEYVHFAAVDNITSRRWILDEMSIEELKFIGETLLELSCDDAHNHGQWYAPLAAIDRRLLVLKNA